MRRICSRVAVVAPQRTTTRQPHCRAHQLGIGRSRGTQTVFFAVVEYLQLHPERVAIIKDVENAFNTVSTRAADVGLKRLDAQDEFGMRRFLRVFYSRVDELSYFLDDGTRTKVCRVLGFRVSASARVLMLTARFLAPAGEPERLSMMVCIAIVLSMNSGAQRV